MTKLYIYDADQIESKCIDHHEFDNNPQRRNVKFTGWSHTLMFRAKYIYMPIVNGTNSFNFEKFNMDYMPSTRCGDARPLLCFRASGGIATMGPGGWNDHILKLEDCIKSNGRAMLDSSDGTVNSVDRNTMELAYLSHLRKSHDILFTTPLRIR